LLSTYQQEQSLLRKSSDHSFEERLSKLLSHHDRFSHDLSSLHDSLKRLSEERRKDVEETTDVIKQTIANGRAEWQREFQRVAVEVERVKRENAEKANDNEVAELLGKISATIETKVEIREVQ